jgi:hypothetical protein
MTARTVRATPAQVRAAAVPPPPAPVVEAVPPPAAPARKVRRTVDLTAAQHRDLNRFLDEAAEVRGWSRANSQDLLATLVARLLADDELQRAVIAELPAPARRGAPR